MKLLRWIVLHPMATVLAVVIVCFSGWYGARQMQVDLFPNLDVPVVNIITHDPGLSPEDMERLISRPVEDALRGIAGVRRVASTSAEGLSQVTAQFTWGTTVRDARQLVQARLAQLNVRLPAGVAPRLESVGTTLQEVCAYVLYGGDLTELRTIAAHDLTARLMGVDGVSSVEVLGGDRRAFFVDLDPPALARLGIGVDQVLDALRAYNITADAGLLEQSGREYIVRGDARFQTLADIRSIPLRLSDPHPVLLGAIATVHEQPEPRHYTVYGDGVPAVAMAVRKQPGASTIRVVDAIEAALHETSGLLPPGTHIKQAYDQSEIIRAARNEIVRDLLLGALMAVGVLYFFLGSLRPTLIVALTIPITLLATLAVLSALGQGLNMITMTALALAIGMIVDDAIVVLENMHRHARQGAVPQTAAVEGAGEIAAADASGTFTTVAAFLPMALMTGLAGIFMRPFGLTISSALLISLALSLTLVPMLFGRSTTPAGPGREDFMGARLLNRLDARLQRGLLFAFRRRGRVLSLAVLSLGLAVLAGFLGRTSVLPPIDEGALLIEYVLPPGTSLEESNRVGETLDRLALAQPEVSCVYRRTGSPDDSSLLEGVNRGEQLIKLAPGRKRHHSAQDVTESLRRAYSKLDGVVFLYHQPTQEKMDESFSGLPAVFGVTVFGPDVAELVRLGGKVEDLLARNPSVGNIVNNTKMTAPQVNVRLDYARLAQYGIDPGAALDTLRAANLGIEATSIVREKEVVGVWVRLARAEAPSPAGLGETPVPTGDGGWLPLSRVADIEIRHAPAAINRLNGQREITLLADVGGNLPAAAARLSKQFKTLDLPEGYSIAITGQVQTLLQTAGDLALVVLAAVVLIYLIVVMQFNSWLQPLIILVTIPLSLVGALVALFVTRQGVDVSVGLGAVTLVGVAVNNAIVLLDFANRERSAGIGQNAALLSAATVRLRPILLTTLTTIAALLPAALAIGAGTRLFQPFAITVIGGLLAGSLATLLIIPTLAAAPSR